jgi:transposase
MLSGMIDPRQKLRELKAKSAELENQLACKDEQLADQEKQLLVKSDIIKQLEAKLDAKEKAYLKLWRERFAAKSERYIANPDQLRLDFGNTEEAADAADGLGEAVEEADLIPAYKRRKPKKKTHELPENLPREVTVVDVDESKKACDTHGEKELLPESMWDVREKLIYHPGSFKILVRKYKKYACAGQPECGITSPERPTGIVEGDKYDTSVATQIITHKYGYHSTLYRLQDMFAGTGWTPSRSVMLNILQQCYFIIEPLLDYFKQTLLDDRIIACDDTGVTLLYPKVPPDLDVSDPKQKRIAEVYNQALEENKSSINAKMWAYRGVNVKLNVFDFTVSRHRNGPDEFFKSYSGTILGDCWHGFGAIAAESGGSIQRAACNSHARRKFESAKDYPADRRNWLQWFQDLFDIEDEGKNYSQEERLALRHDKAKPIWELMRAELDSADDRTEQVVLPKSDLRKALNYLRNHWRELRAYLDDAQLPMDNNECEQLMKQVAVGRKNWMFAGSLTGGERSAGFMTLVSSAYRNDLDIWAYVNDVLTQLLAGTTDYEPLLPWNWAITHHDCIRTYRQDERSEREQRKQTTRARRSDKKARQKKLASKKSKSG